MCFFHFFTFFTFFYLSILGGGITYIVVRSMVTAEICKIQGFFYPRETRPLDNLDRSGNDLAWIFEKCRYSWKKNPSKNINFFYPKIDFEILIEIFLDHIFSHYKIQCKKIWNNLRFFFRFFYIEFYNGKKIWSKKFFNQNFKIDFRIEK